MIFPCQEEFFHILCAIEMKKFLPVALMFLFSGVILLSMLNSQALTGSVKENSEEENNLNLEEDNMDFKELKIETVIEGEGKEAVDGDTLVVNYLGTLKDGIKFDSSYDRNQPFEFVLGASSVIEGWEKGLVGMKTGEKRRLEIPSSMGYGHYQVGSIPADSGLVFEIELLEIK